MQNGALETLLEKHCNNTISSDERKVLHELLSKKYEIGDAMLEYKCPNCSKPLVLTYSKGPACWSFMGCGFKYEKNLSKSI